MSWLLFPKVPDDDMQRKLHDAYVGYVKDGRIVITEPKFAGILRDWEASVATPPQPPRFPWEIPVTTALVAALVLLLLLG